MYTHPRHGCIILLSHTQMRHFKIEGFKKMKDMVPMTHGSGVPRMWCKTRKKHQVTDSSDLVLLRDVESGPREAMDPPSCPRHLSSHWHLAQNLHWRFSSRSNPFPPARVDKPGGGWDWSSTRPVYSALFTTHSLTKSWLMAGHQGTWRFDEGERVLTWKTPGVGVGSMWENQQ